MLIVAIASRFSATGKTTGCCRLARALIEQGVRVLLLDLVPNTVKEQAISPCLQDITKLAQLPTHVLVDARGGRRPIASFAVGGAMAFLPIDSELLRARTMPYNIRFWLERDQLRHYE